MSEANPALSARQALVGNRELTRHQIEAFALGLFSNAHPQERPGYMYGDVWKFRRWDDLTDAQRDEWRQKALKVYSTLVAYGQRLVSLDG